MTSWVTHHTRYILDHILTTRVIVFRFIYIFGKPCFLVTYNMASSSFAYKASRVAGLFDLIQG